MLILNYVNSILLLFYDSCTVRTYAIMVLRNNLSFVVLRQLCLFAISPIPCSTNLFTKTRSVGYSLHSSVPLIFIMSCACQIFQSHFFIMRPRNFNSFYLMINISLCSLSIFSKSSPLITCSVHQQKKWKCFSCDAFR